MIEQRHPVFELSHQLVDELAALFPDDATYLGVAGHDDLWTDLSPTGVDAAVGALRDMRRRVDALPQSSDQWSSLAAAVATSVIDEMLASYADGEHLRDLRSIASPAQGFREVFDNMAKDTPEAWHNIVSRLQRLPAAMAGYQATLDQGRVSGEAVARRQVHAVMKQARITASDESAFAGLMDEYAAAGIGDDLEQQLATAIETGKAAFAALADYLDAAYLDSARDHDGVGWDRYITAARRYLGTTIDPEETYAWGWEEIVRIRRRMEEVAGRIAPDGDIRDAIALLKTDPKRAARDRGAFVEFVAQRLEHALEGLAGSHFDVPEPIRRVEVHLTPPGGPLGAHYVGPSEDFTRPGTVWWTLDGDGPFPLYDEVTTAYHEGFPGHHLQVGIQVSLADRLSRLHRLWEWRPGTGEGWALYAERLMHELGFLDLPDYEFGLLGAQMLRSCRIAVDIGSHVGLEIPTNQPFHPGEPWSFQTAVELLTEYATLAEPYAVSEVTRYLGWPGQAIAYKYGERAILGVREELEKRRGAAFDLKAFHARLLEVGPVGIDLMRDRMLAGP